MKNTFTNSFTVLSILLGLLYNAAHSANPSNATASVVKFQQKMAERGHAESQFKLGFMFETAQGLDRDLQMANHWYLKAADNKNLAAKNRLIYLDILKNGYNSPKHNAWLLRIKQAAEQSQGESALLLGQLYASGTGVPRSLTLSLNYLRIASAANIAYADTEIRRVEDALDELQQAFRQNESSLETASPETK